MKKFLSTILAVSLVFSVMFGIAVKAPAYAEDKVVDAPLPFAYSNAALQTEEVSMSGNSYSDAILFSMGYTGVSNGNTAEVTYNLKGLYTSLSFDAGFVKGYQKNATVSVIADGNTLIDAQTVYYENIPVHFTVPVEGVSQLVIRFQSSGYDKAHYAIGGVTATASEDLPEAGDLVSYKNYDTPCYLKKNTGLLTQTFGMGGYTYENGYLMKMGYNSGYTAKLSFNFNKQYEKMSFDIAKYMNRASETYTRSAFMTIEVDGTVLEPYNNLELKWNDISRPVEIDLTDVSQVTVTVNSDGYDSVNWALGNIQMVRVPNPGDATDDGKVNIADVSLILKHIAKWDVDLNTDNADVTDDGKINLADVSLLLKHIAKWDVVLK